MSREVPTERVVLNCPFAKDVFSKLHNGETLVSCSNVDCTAVFTTGTRVRGKKTIENTPVLESGSLLCEEVITELNRINKNLQRLGELKTQTRFTIKRKAIFEEERNRLLNQANRIGLFKTEEQSE